MLSPTQSRSKFLIDTTIPLLSPIAEHFISSLCVVKRFHKGEVTSVVTDVSKFMETLLNDCSDVLDNDSDFPSDPEEMNFLVLRVLSISFWIQGCNAPNSHN